MAVETSIVVVFGEGAESGGNVVVELDPLNSSNWINPSDESEGLKSTFDSVAPGVPYLLLHMSSGLVLTNIIPSAGSIEEYTWFTTPQEREVDFSFAKITDESSIGYSNAVLSSADFLKLSRTGEVKLNSAGETILYSSGEVPFKGVATVNVPFQHSFIINAPTPLDLASGETFEITVWIYVDVAS